MTHRIHAATLRADTPVQRVKSSRNISEAPGVLVTANLEAYFRAVIDWLCVALVFSALNSLYPLLTSEPTASLDTTMLLKHRHAMLIRNIPGLDLSVSWATGSFIAMNIGDLVLEQREVRLDVGALQKQR